MRGIREFSRAIKYELFRDFWIKRDSILYGELNFKSVNIIDNKIISFFLLTLCIDIRDMLTSNKVGYAVNV